MRPKAQEGGEQGDKLAGTPGCLLHTQALSPLGSRAVEADGRGARGETAEPEAGEVAPMAWWAAVVIHGVWALPLKWGWGGSRVPLGSFSTEASLNQCLKMNQKKGI